MKMTMMVVMDQKMRKLMRMAKKKEPTVVASQQLEMALKIPTKNRRFQQLVATEVPNVKPMMKLAKNTSTP